MKRLFYDIEISLATKSQPLINIFKKVEKTIALSPFLPILIYGETGTGKEGVAKAIHWHSPRKSKPLIIRNCAEITGDLAGSILFGHKKGAFTGAITDSDGLFHSADGGTLFLDEIDKLSPSVQAKLLRVLQEGEFVPLGETKPQSADIRLVTASNKDLDLLIKEGKFLQDLYFRIAGDVIILPPLRERQEDIKPLTDIFLKEFAQKENINVKSFSKKVLNVLLQHQWPGNVRELQRTIHTAICNLRQSNNKRIEIEDLPEKIRSAYNNQKPTHPYNTASLRKAIIDMLEQKSCLSVSEIEAKTKRDRDAIRRQVERLREQGRVKVIKRKGRNGSVISLIT